MYKQISVEGEPRTWFSHPKMQPGGFLGLVGSRPPTHSPKTPPNHDLSLICVPSGLICRRFLVHFFKKVRNVPAHGCAFGNSCGLARGRHSWHGGGVAEANWIIKAKKHENRKTVSWTWPIENITKTAEFCPAVSKITLCGKIFFAIHSLRRTCFETPRRPDLSWKQAQKK